MVGKEVGESGTPHLQAFICYESAKTFNAVKRKFPRAHLAPKAKKSTFEEASKYCKKGEQPKAEWDEFKWEGENFGLNADVFEKGTLPMDSKKKGEVEQCRWKRARELAVAGNFDEIDDQIFIRCYGTLKKIRMDKVMASKKPDTTERHFWFWGKSGTGKSRTARELWPDAYLKMCNKWWDGYVPESRATVLIEDFDKRHECLIHHLKIWSDRYDFIGEIKTTSARIRPLRVVVTSNYHPSTIWGDAWEDVEPIMRRFEIVEFTDNTVLPAAVETFVQGQQ